MSLVIAPDSSSNDYEVHKQLAERQVDVLVIDHHEAERVSEFACIINNQLCDYPTKSLFIHIPECNNDVNNYIMCANIIKNIINKLV